MHIIPSILALFLIMSSGLRAAPVGYTLEADESTVGFETDFGQNHIRGTMPIRSADLALDFDDVSRSKVSVRVDVRKAKTGVPFATDALKGQSVLDARDYPEIAFVSRKVRKAGDGAVIEGDITIRGVTKPIRLNAQIYRQRDTQAGDLSHLSILLTGAVSRAAFGATGFPDMVGDEVRLKVLARIARID